jgi:hypothetical protein
MVARVPGGGPGNVLLAAAANAGDFNCRWTNHDDPVVHGEPQGEKGPPKQNQVWRPPEEEIGKSN